MAPSELNPDDGVLSPGLKKFSKAEQFGILAQKNFVWRKSSRKIFLITIIASSCQKFCQVAIL
jgi:hypothetical protein